MMFSSTHVPVPENIPILDVDPYGDDVLENPFAMHDAVRSIGSVGFMKRYGVYVMGRYSDIVPTLKDWQRFSSTSGSGIADIRREDAWREPSPIVEVDPPDHTKVRMAVQRILSPVVLRQWRERFKSMADERIDRLLERAGIVDAAQDLAEDFVAEAFPQAIGWAPHPERQERLMLLGALNFDGQGPRNERFLATQAAAEPIMEWNNAQMRREALEPGGFGEQIYQAADRGDIDAATAPLLIRSFIRGGLDTTVSMLTAAIHHLANAPDQYARLRADPSVIRIALDEAMRLETPIQNVCRLTMEDVTFGDGRSVPRNNKIIILLASANRDPQAWNEPDRFLIDRPRQNHVALGNGVHMCIGQMIARMEGEVLLQSLTEKVGSITPAGKPNRRLNNNLRSFSSVPVELRPA